MNDEVFPSASSPASIESVKYLQAQTALIMTQIGNKLHLIYEGNTYDWAAHEIRGYVRSHLAENQEQLTPTKSPCYLPIQRLSSLPHTDPLALIAMLKGLAVMMPTEVCPIEQNLNWLTELMSLSPVGKQLLLWAHCNDQYSPHRLYSTLRRMPITGEEHAHRILATFFEVPVEAVSECFSSPSRLFGMGVLEGHPQANRMETLAEYLSCHLHLRTVLDLPHQSKKLLSDYLIKRSTDGELFFDKFHRSVTFSKQIPMVVAQACRSTIDDTALDQRFIEALTNWFKVYPRQDLHIETQSESLNYLTIERVIKTHCLTCSRSNTLVTQQSLWNALNLASH